MRTTMTFDETLLAQARMLCGISDRSAPLREALTALMQRESAPCQARLGGSTRFAGNSASPPPPWLAASLSTDARPSAAGEDPRRPR